VKILDLELSHTEEVSLLKMGSGSNVRLPHGSGSSPREIGSPRANVR
jgi:hypothetical protein